MAVGRILCIGTGNQLTSPQAQWMDGRVYKYAPPGIKITHYQGEQTRSGELPLEIRETSCASQYGILEIEDFIIKQLIDKVLPWEDAKQNEFTDKLIVGANRAKSLVSRWTSTRISWDHPHYGAVLMSGEVPTEEEIKSGMEARRRYAIARLTEEKKNQTLRLQGARGYKAGWDAADLAWAAEFGFSIEIALDKVQSPPNSPERESADEGRVACPFCAEMIMPAAKKCRFCTRTFDKLTVAEYNLAETAKGVPA